ncbi:MAG TPA: adenylate/guanylate cyclase domain-containing protein [Ktedonobacterales bacterium]|nr:adenylate/guanylate cyclase domain-containing protein [Ktedonobacterales bacterium]
MSTSVGEAAGASLAVSQRLPSGTVTFLFTDIEGSTRLLQRLGAQRYAVLLDEYLAILRAAVAAHEGHEVDSLGDSFFAVFPAAGAALAAAAEAQLALAAHAWPEGAAVQVRMGLHTGAPQLAGEDGARYVGLDVHRAARIAAAGHGGQVLLSEATAALVRDQPPGEGAWLRDLGTHRLKDLRRPERLYQLVLDGLPIDFPPLKTLDAHAHNLPIQPTPLLGRQRDVEQVAALLRREHMHLVTITGPGGVGKTRLGVQVAAELVDAFPDGVWLVRLSQLTDPALVLPAIARTLELREGGDQSLADTLRTHLRERRLLLLLDNFEQVVVAAPELSALLEVSTGLKMLVTSRTTLHVRGEHEYAVAPLALPPTPDDPAHLPPLDQLSQYAAVALFVARARAVRADFAMTTATAPAVAAICARLDGLPLAIELAAARVKLLPPRALLKQVERREGLPGEGPRDLEERQRTMQRTIAWSYDLLSAEEQRLFRRLSVFVGGWTLEAAEAICSAPEGTEPLAIEVLAGLGALLDHSLVQRRAASEEAEGDEDGAPRFSMLHVIREYALGQLEAQHDEANEANEAQATQAAHAAYFVTGATEAARALGLGGDASGTWRAWLALERDNLASALTWASAHGHMNEALWIGAALAGHDIAHWSYSEARRRLEHLLTMTAEAAANGAVDSEARLLAVSRAALFASAQHDLTRATQLHQEQLAVARQMDEPRYAADALSGLALLALDWGTPGEAVRYAEESLAVARRASDDSAVAYALENLSLARFVSGELEQARVLAEEGLELSRRAGFLWGQGINAGTLALICCREGDPMGALRLMREGYGPLRDHGALHGLTGILRVAACAWAVAGDGYRCARVLGAAEAEMTRAEGTPGPAFLRWTDELTAPVRAVLGEDRWAEAFAAGRALSLEEAIAEALDEPAPIRHPAPRGV